MLGFHIGHNGDDYLVAESRVPLLNRHHAVTVYTTFSRTTLRRSSPVRRSDGRTETRHHGAGSRPAE